MKNSFYSRKTLYRLPQSVWQVQTLGLTLSTFPPRCRHWRGSVGDLCLCSPLHEAARRLMLQAVTDSLFMTSRVFFLSLEWVFYGKWSALMCSLLAQWRFPKALYKGLFFTHSHTGGWRLPEAAQGSDDTTTDKDAAGLEAWTLQSLVDLKLHVNIDWQLKVKNRFVLYVCCLDIPSLSRDTQSMMVIHDCLWSGPHSGSAVLIRTISQE